MDDADDADAALRRTDSAGGDDGIHMTVPASQPQEGSTCSVCLDLLASQVVVTFQHQLVPSIQCKQFLTAGITMLRTSLSRRMVRLFIRLKL